MNYSDHRSSGACTQIWPVLHQTLREGAPRPDSDGCHLKQRKVPWDLFITPGERRAQGRTLWVLFVEMLNGGMFRSFWMKFEGLGCTASQGSANEKEPRVSLCSVIMPECTDNVAVVGAPGRS